MLVLSSLPHSPRRQPEWFCFHRFPLSWYFLGLCFSRLALKNRNIIITSELVGNAELRLCARSPKSEYAFLQDLQVVPVLIRVLGPRPIPGCHSGPADNDWHTTSILGCATALPRDSRRQPCEEWEARLKESSRLYLFNALHFLRSFIHQGSSWYWLPRISAPKAHVLFIKFCCLSWEECWAVCSITLHSP